MTRDEMREQIEAILDTKLTSHSGFDPIHGKDEAIAAILALFDPALAEIGRLHVVVARLEETHGDDRSVNAHRAIGAAWRLLDAAIAAYLAAKEPADG